MPSARAGAKFIASLLLIPAMQQCCSQLCLVSGVLQSIRSQKATHQVACRCLKRLKEKTPQRLLIAPRRGTDCRTGCIRSADRSAQHQNSIPPQENLWMQVLSDFIYCCHSQRPALLLAQNNSQVWYYSMEWGALLYPNAHQTNATRRSLSNRL